MGNPSFTTNQDILSVPKHLRGFERARSAPRIQAGQTKASHQETDWKCDPKIWEHHSEEFLTMWEILSPSLHCCCAWSNKPERKTKKV